ADALSRGGELLYGGRRAARKGYFFEPTVVKFADGSAEARVLREEVFGPVLPVAPFDDEEEAVELANATQYGLQASVFTADYRKAFRVAKSVRAGAVMVYDST
ncbi:MAG: aldehyde dehydrogenase family protein, partial [Conexivisphaera sp.]